MGIADDAAVVPSGRDPAPTLGAPTADLTDVRTHASGWRARMRRRPLLLFFVLANLFSWAAWAPLALQGLGWTSTQVSPYLHLVGGLGPLLAAVAMTAASDGRAGLARLLQRCLPMRSQLGWLAVAITAPLLLFAISAYALGIAGKGHVAWTDIGRSVEYPALSRGAYWAANIVCYGLGEEVGWRGFALPRLQAKHSALTAALLVSGAWAMWHLPLFAFAGGLSSMGVGAASGWLFSLVTGSILMTGLFNASGGSILAVALFHGVLDIMMTSPVNGPLPSIVGAIMTLCGLAVPLIFGRTNLARAPRVRDSARA